ncbi:NTP transferase domain-containing protein [Patescibacteria group bacterium]|nr:NTP transferase domain-containing protein [Patescibacteria group bacterium]
MENPQTQITKAVIIAAGFGTRFLPATKNQPKEMLPIIDKPILHYVVEEAVNSGIRDIILVTRFGNHLIEDYFDNRYELEAQLESSRKTKRLEMVRNIPQMANFVYVRQKGHLPYGNGSPLIAIKELIDENDSFVYMFADDLTWCNGFPPITKQLIDAYLEHNAVAAVGVQEVPWEEVDRYGTVKYKDENGCEVEGIMEKLPKEEAYSNKVQFGRFVFSYDVIRKAEETKPGKDNELWVSDILNELAHEGKKVIAPPIKGEWLTTGDPLRYLKTSIKFALRRDDLREKILDFIKNEASES